jgi:molecular chaperone GrpE
VSAPRSPTHDGDRCTLNTESNDMSNRRDRTKRAPAPDPARAEEEPTPEETSATTDDPADGGDRGEVEMADDTSRELSTEVERLQGELGELNDRHLRLAAEFDNFRRRSQSQLGESGARAQAALVGRLLEILDDFHRVSSIEPDQATVESVLEGVELVEKKLHRVLAEAGLEPIDPVDEPFDPNSMEAIMREPAASEEDDETVSSVFQLGYVFRGHLLRPARVSVRKA